MAEETKQSPIQVIDRSVALLDALVDAGGAASLKILAAQTGLPSSTAFRILAALRSHDLVSKDDSGDYRLGARLLRYASRATQQVDLRQLARPVMDALRDAVGETVNLTVREGDEVIYVERSLPNRMMRVEQVIGSRAPLHVTAVGKLMLAESGPAACRDYAKRSKLRRYTANTITDVDRLLQETHNAMTSGFARDNEEAETGVACIGVLIRDLTGNAVAGLSISAPRERHQSHWLQLLKEAGAKLSRQLGYHPKAN